MRIGRLRLEIVLVLALVLLWTLSTLGSFLVNAASNDSSGKPALAFNLLPRATELPPTPTKTPTVEPTQTPTSTPLPPLATNTPTVHWTPTATPTIVPTVSPELATLVRRYGFNPNERFILVNQNLQQMTVADKNVVRTFPVSTGDPERLWHTPAWSGRVGKYWGTFSTGEVYADYGWYLFKARGSILIHGAPYTFDELGNKIYQDLDAIGAYPASHGCIRMTPNDVEWLTNWNPLDVAMIILPYDGGNSRQG